MAKSWREAHARPVERRKLSWLRYGLKIYDDNIAKQALQLASCLIYAQPFRDTAQPQMTIPWLAAQDIYLEDRDIYPKTSNFNQDQDQNTYAEKSTFKTMTKTSTLNRETKTNNPRLKTSPRHLPSTFKTKTSTLNRETKTSTRRLKTKPRHLSWRPTHLLQDIYLQEQDHDI